MKIFYKNKKILITGAAGTVGKEIVNQLCLLDPSEIRLMDNNETEMFLLMEYYQKNKKINCFLGDVRDRDKVIKLSNSIDIIIHTAAFKHVLLSEYNPFDIVQTNIIGVENIVRAANVCKVKNVLFTSSDKAVNPTNVMGTSKLMGERLMTAANAVKNGSSTIFTSIRFGNVLGSRGSVVPIFIKQIRDGGPVSLTDKRMTRFIMTIEEAAKLVLKSLPISKGGEVFVAKMPVVRISDLSEVMVEILAQRYGYNSSKIEIIETGAKPGEKLYEELMSEEEIHRSLELKDMYVILPAFKSIYQFINYTYTNIILNEVRKPYKSLLEKPFSKDKLKQYLIENKVLETITGNLFLKT